MQEYVTKRYRDTVALGEEFAKTLPKGSVIAFLGDIGMGKTAFTTGLAKGLGIDADVTSPTFAICNTYVGRDNTLHHFDMYRVESWGDLYSTGFFDYLDTDAYMAIEWSENIYSELPDDAIIIEIERLSDDERKFRIYKKNEEE